MDTQLTKIAIELLKSFGKNGVSTERFWPALLLRAPDTAPTEPEDRLSLLDAMKAEIVNVDGKNKVVFMNGEHGTAKSGPQTIEVPYL